MKINLYISLLSVVKMNKHDESLKLSDDRVELKR